MEKYRIDIKKSAGKEIKHLPRRDIKTILGKIRSLSDHPRPHDCKKLSGQERYQIRCGDYRIVYSIEDDALVVYVVKAGQRRDVDRLNRSFQTMSKD